MKYTIVKNSLVTNMVEWDGSSDFPVDGELVQADENAYIGGTYNGSFVARPVEPDPEPTEEELEREAALDALRDKLKALGLTTKEMGFLGIPEEVESASSIIQRECN